MPKHSYVDPGGRRLTIDGTYEVDLLLWQSQFAVTSRLNGRVPDSLLTRTLTASDLRNHDDWLIHSAKAHLVGEYVVSGGVLEIWKPSDDRDQGLGRWIGPFHEITTFLPFQMWENHDFVLGYFDGLNFQDASDGVIASPVSPSDSVTVLDVSALVGGLGVFEVMRPEVGLGQVPSWAGMKIPAGEVWKVSNPDNANITDHLLMSSRSAVATMTADAGRGFDDCLSFLRNIAVLDYGKEGQQ